MDTFLFVGGQCGFTLVETVVAVGIVALLTFGIVTLSLALRHGALRAAIASFDASFASARDRRHERQRRDHRRASAIGCERGSAAGVCVARLSRAPDRCERSNARRRPGHRSRCRRARSDARPAAFAIFLSTAGNASGQAAYPAVGSDGAPQFAAIPKQPACPFRGLVLTFSPASALPLLSFTTVPDAFVVLAASRASRRRRYMRLRRARRRRYRR